MRLGVQGQGRRPLRVLEGVCSRERRRAGIVGGVCGDARQPRVQEDQERRGQVSGNCSTWAFDVEFQQRPLRCWKGWKDRDNGPSNPSSPNSILRMLCWREMGQRGLREKRTIVPTLPSRLQGHNAGVHRDFRLDIFERMEGLERSVRWSRCSILTRNSPLFRLRPVCEVAPEFRTTGLVGGSLLRKALNGAEHDEDETED